MKKFSFPELCEVSENLKPVAMVLMKGMKQAQSSAERSAFAKLALAIAAAGMAVSSLGLQRCDLEEEVERLKSVNEQPQEATDNEAIVGRLKSSLIANQESLEYVSDPSKGLGPTLKSRIKLLKWLLTGELQ